LGRAAFCLRSKATPGPTLEALDEQGAYRRNKEAIMAQIPIATRLQSFRLNAETIKPADLNISPNQHVVLDTGNTTFKNSLTYLTPQTIDDVKNWLGNPNSAFVRTPTAPQTGTTPIAAPLTRVRDPSVLPPVIIHPGMEHSAKEVEQLHALASTFVFGHSENVSAAQLPALNSWIAGLKIKLPIYVFNNITVAAGAVLDVRVNALFANYITVEYTGRIKLRGGSRTVIHAAGFTGKGPRIIPLPPGGIVLQPG
jgi:hypothetical protein